MEIWKPIRDFPSYDCSNYGRIRNIRTQHILKPHASDRGNMIVSLRKNNKIYPARVHIIVAETFLGEHVGMDVKHRDFDKTNNHVENLYWVTRSEVVKRTYTEGRRKAWREVPVRVVETGKVYGTFKECALDIGCDPADVRKCAIGERRSAKGYHFELV